MRIASSLILTLLLAWGGPAADLRAERLDRGCLRALLAPQSADAVVDVIGHRQFVIASNGTENPFAGCARSFAYSHSSNWRPYA